MISLLGLGAVCIILQNTSLREWGLRSYVQDGLFGTGQVLGPHRSTEISQATCRIQSIHSPLNPGFPKEHCNNLGLRKSCSVSQSIRRKRGSDVRKGLVDAVEGGVQFSSVRSLSCIRLFATPWTAAHQASLSHHQLPEFTQTHVHRVGDAIQPSHPLSSPSPPAPNPSQHQSLFQ